MSYNANTKIIYVDTSTTPHTGVSIGDLQQCFNTQIRATINGQTVTRLSSDLGVICGKKQGDTFSDGGVTWTVFSRAEINKWAKWKPIVFNKVTMLSLANYQSKNYGIVDIPTWSRLTYMSTFLFSDTRASENRNVWPRCDSSKQYISIEYWGYQLPTGGSASPYRLTDFINPDNFTQGYFHNAEAPFGPIKSTAVNITPNGWMRLSFTKGAEDVRTLTLADFVYPDNLNYSVGNMYFGVLMQQVQGTLTVKTYVGTQRIISTGDGGSVTDIKVSQMGSQGPYVDVPPNNLEVGDTHLTGITADFAGRWKIYPILCSQPIPYTSSIATYDSGYYIALLPYHSEINISITYAKVEIVSASAYITRVNQHYRAVFQILLRNQEDTDRRCDVTITLYNQNGTAITIPHDDTSPKTFSNLLAPANSSFTVYPYTGAGHENDYPFIDIESLDATTRNNLYFTVSTEINAAFDHAVFKTSDSWRLTQVSTTEPDPSNPTPFD